MSIVREVERGLALLLLLAVIALGGWAWVNSKRIEAVQVQYQHTAGDARAATVYIRERGKVEKAKGVKDVEVARTLEGHRDWADTQLPDDVVGLLRNAEGTTRAVP